MSGDVQPRKRKDKRRKKEGTSLGSIHEPIASHKFRRSESEDQKSFDLPDQGEKIHVQNEHGIGGNICVKIIFFCLFGLLLAAVGLIYLKSQGSTDVDLPTLEESRFAEYFTGWLDDSADDHEHEAHESHVYNDDHEDDHGNHEDEHNDHDEEDDHEHEHEEEQSLEQDLIYKLFGLQNDKDDEVEEEDMKPEEVPVSESAISHDDVDEDEDEDEDENDSEHEHEENDISNTEEEDDEEEDENDNEHEHVENDKNNTEEEDDKEEEEKNVEDNDEDIEEDDVDKGEEEEVEDDVDKGEEEEVEDDDDSGVDLGELVNDSADDDNKDKDKDEDEDEDEDEDDDLSQMDEDEEDKHISSHIRKSFKGDDEESEENGKLKEEEDDIDDDAIEEEELNDDDENDKNESEMKEDDKNNEEINKGKDLKVSADNDDLSFEEIDISEEDLGTEDEQKVKDDNEDNLIEEKRRKSAAAGVMDKLKAKQVESGFKGEEVEKEEDDDEAGGGVVVKLGVGIALIIVAHLVLVKKWKSMNNVSSDESVPNLMETVSKKQEIENLHSSVESIISRRQTLVPENVSLNDDLEEEDEEEVEEEEIEDEEEEEEDVEDGEGYSEEECEEEEFVKSKTDNWKLFEKPAWNVQKEKTVEKEYEEPIGHEEIEEEEEEYEEEDAEEMDEEQEQDEVEEEEEDEGDEEEEEYDEDDVEDDNIVQKPVPTTYDSRREEVKEAAPTPPPRTRHGRGGQDIDDNDDVMYFEEINEVEEPSQDGFLEDEVNNNSGPEEQKTQEKKVGSEDEWNFRQELDFADEQFANNPKAAVDAYDRIISRKPTMLKALVGRAKALDHWAEKEKSNAHLKQAINAYKTLLFDHGDLLDDETYVKLAERCIERMRFAGNFISAIEIHKALILKFPDAPKYRNSLAVTYLMLNKIPQARVLLNETLNLWPGNGFALVHYGFILKTSDNNMEEGAEKLMAGIQTREEGVIEGMFFFHLGDALNRLGREKEAMKWYELGVKEGLFLSKYQRSLYNVDRLKGQPWWTKEETTYQQFFKKLEENWREIRREGLELLNSKGVNLFKEEAENLKDTGDWKQLDLYFRGRKQLNCNKAPITCSLVSSFKPASTCTRGQIKFSVMLPNTHVWPHCGPTNCRLRSHLGLVVPKKTFIRVAEETRSWEEGKVIIFDDSFEHEVWHNGTGPRLVLIVDVWHPELSNHERRTLSPI